MEENNNKSKTLIIILIVALVCALGVIIYLLCFNKKEEPKKEENKQQENQQEDDDEEEIRTETIDFNGKKVTIKYTDEGTYINNKRIGEYPYEEVQVMNNYLVFMWNGAQHGSHFIFLDEDLNEIPIDVKYVYSPENWNYEKGFDFSNNKIKADFVNMDYEPGSGDVYSFDNLSVFVNTDNKTKCPDGSKKVYEYKDKILPHKDDILSGTIELSYDGKKMNYTYIKKVTVWDTFGKAIENQTADYCVEEYKD